MPDTADAMLDHDLPCAGCGYNLRGLVPDGRCPECGRAVQESLDAHRPDVPRRVWSDLARGAGLVASASLVSLVTSFWPTGNPWGDEKPQSAWEEGTILAAGLFPFVAAWFGALVTSRPRVGDFLPRGRVRAVTRRVAWPLRITATVGALGPPVWIAIPALPPHGDYAVVAIRVAFGLCAAAGTFLLFAYVVPACEVAGRPWMSRQSAFLAVAAPAAVAWAFFTGYPNSFGGGLLVWLLKDLPLVGVGYPTSLRWLYFWLRDPTWIPSWSHSVTAAAVATAWATGLLFQLAWVFARLARQSRQHAAPAQPHVKA